MNITNILNDILELINKIPKIIQFPLAAIIFIYSMLKFGDITNRISNRASNSERNLRYSYNNAVRRLATGNFNKIVTREHCEKIVELYKDGIPKQNKLKRFAATIGDFILMIISVVIMIGAYMLIK